MPFEPLNISLPNFVGDATSWTSVSWGKKLFAIFKVMVTVRAHMITIWIFLLYLVNCWFFGNQTWSDDTSLWARVNCEKNYVVLHSRSWSQWRVKISVFIQMLLSKLPNILLPNLVLWCIIISWSVMQIDWFALFKVSVTAGALVIKIWQCLLNLLNHSTFCYQTWYSDAVSWARVLYRKNKYFPQGEGHSKGSYDQNMTFYYISAKTVDSLATKRGLMIHH